MTASMYNLLRMIAENNPVHHKVMLRYDNRPLRALWYRGYVLLSAKLYFHITDAGIGALNAYSDDPNKRKNANRPLYREAASRIKRSA